MYNNNHAVQRRSDLSRLASKLRKHTVSDQGAAFVAEVCDPFSDDPQRILGMPDQTSGKSITYDIRQEVTITRPEALGENDPFDVHVATMPIIGTNNLTGPSDPCRHVGYNQETGGVFDIAPVASWTGEAAVIAVCKVASGDNTFDPTDTAAEYQFVEAPVLLDPNVRSRCISLGYEVINETEELYKSGANTDYRVDADLHWQQFRGPISEGDPVIRESGYRGTLPPLSLAQAKQVNGVTRESSEGSLVVACYDSAVHPAELPRQGQALLMSSAPDGEPGGVVNCLSLGDDEAFSNEPNKATYVRELPFLQSGTFATGLSGRSKLRLVVHIVVEVFPRPGSALMPLATIAPSYDPVAFELVSELQSQTLPGYPVSWNNSGKFTRALEAAARFFKRPSTWEAALAAGAGVAAGLGQPGVSLGLAAASRGVGAAKKKQNSNNKKK